MSKAQRLPHRSEVKVADTWDLSSLFADDEAWEKAFQRLERQIKGYEKFRGQLGKNAETLAACLKFDSQLDRLGERLGVYAFLKTTEDQTNSQYQRMLGRFENVATRAAEAASYIRPELLALPTSKIKKLLADKKLKPYRLLIERLVRYRKHTLGKQEEELLAMQGEMAQAASRAFRQLHDADMKFGFVTNEKGEKIELSNCHVLAVPDLAQTKCSTRRPSTSTTSSSPLTRTRWQRRLSGSILKDVYYARARHYPSALDAALFPDNVPRSVYDNLIEAIHGSLPAVHHYFDVRRRKMRLKEIHHYDTYVPILSELETRTDVGSGGETGDHRARAAGQRLLRRA